MTMARAHLVDPAVTRWYHCVSRCVRRAFLLGEGEHDRKAWIENRIRELAEIFAVAVAGFAVLDNQRRKGQALFVAPRSRDCKNAWQRRR